MCAGLAVLCGPPTVAGCCYGTYKAGQEVAVNSFQIPNHPTSFMSAGAGLGALVGSYKLQKFLLVRHFDEGGALSLNFQKGTQSLGEPLKIATWKDFYRATGPPVFARTGALVLSCFAAGAAQKLFAASMKQMSK